MSEARNHVDLGRELAAEADAEIAQGAEIIRKAAEVIRQNKEHAKRIRGQQTCRLMLYPPGA